MVIGELQGKFGGIPGVKTFATAPSAIPIGAGEMPVEFVIKYPGDYTQVAEQLDTIDAEAKKSGLFIFTNTDLRFSRRRRPSSSSTRTRPTSSASA